ncbi:RrF2 family transcriptional regulator [Leptospira idonii]|uniref:Rrf2 family transcriptional regulator n=1 Tax=Leptospira idonii TaxID=1193500 RepID=A0A4R9LZW5_9LEPT|nr:Rrf2 family transcriptional regulator [Leptospira idonii]TGN17690.1 Rrf2 family transcriptional regulator [Leptospira idonii]
MILGNQVEWTLHCMSVLSWFPEDVAVPSKLLAEFHGVRKDYLLKALQRLAGAGIVVTTTGPKGGYRLAKSPEEISLLEIIEAVEGRQSSFHCQEIRKNNPCNKTTGQKSPVCSIAAVMYKADHAWRDVLKKTKLSDVIRDVNATVPQKSLAESKEWFLERI